MLVAINIGLNVKNMSSELGNNSQSVTFICMSVK